MTRKALSVLALAVLLTGWASLAGGDEARVQAAKRYHAEQIQNDDVLLRDPAQQQFIQSDVFRRIVADKKFLRAAWARQVVRAALGDIDLERVRHEISDTPTPGLWRFELEKVILELDGVPWPCHPCRS